jgi:septum formation protein
VLASGSPRRRELLARLGLTPEVRPAEIDETPGEDELPEELVLRLARAKAAAARSQRVDGPTSDEVVLAADTVVTLDDRVLGKPRDHDDADAMLRSLSGRTHEVVTGVAAARGSLQVADVVITAVTFRRLTDAEVAWYLDTGEPSDKAGAYGLQGAGAVLVERVDGSDTNVIGLPLAETVALLRRVGLDVLEHTGPPTAP